MQRRTPSGDESVRASVRAPRPIDFGKNGQRLRRFELIVATGLKRGLIRVAAVRNFGSYPRHGFSGCPDGPSTPIGDAPDGPRKEVFTMPAEMLREPVGNMELFQGKYLSLTSFRRDGSGVATPVWFVADNGHLLVETDADSYKVKRIRRDPHVRIAVCDARGRRRGEAVDAEAEI